MKLLLMISLRNLVRQKRRNILLGIAMAFGAMILVFTNSFSHGISDMIFNRLLKSLNGHISVWCTREGNTQNQIFPDEQRMMAAIHKSIPDLKGNSEKFNFFVRIIGNGKADNAFVNGVDISKPEKKEDIQELSDNFKFIGGSSFKSLFSNTDESYVGISERQAKNLNVSLGDIIKLRFSDVSGQLQSVPLKVTCVFKPANPLMGMTIVLESQRLKKIFGYQSYEGASQSLTIPYPKKYAKLYADKLHDNFKPGLACISGISTCKGRVLPVVTLGFRNDSLSHLTIAQNVQVESGDTFKAYGREGVIINNQLSTKLNAKVGDTVNITYESKFDSSHATLSVVINAVASPTSPIPQNALLVNEKDFYRAFYRPWPRISDSSIYKSLPDSSNPLFKALAPEFILMKRVSSSDEWTREYNKFTRLRYKGVLVDVQSMYETGSMILNLESALNLITLYAALVLFFIILIGVVNSLHMTIRERTREIGTVRAIGMQKSDVRNTFLIETFFLALISSAIGTLLALLLMGALSLIKINAEDNVLTALLVSGHLHFVPSVVNIIGYSILIILMALGTAFFPARKAAKLSAAEALRHFE